MARVDVADKKMRLTESRGPQPRPAEARYSFAYAHAAVSAGCGPETVASIAED